MTQLSVYRLACLSCLLFFFTTCKQKTPPPLAVSALAVNPCDFQPYLDDPKTPALAKTIFRGQNWDINDFDVLGFLDSLDADGPSRYFYFKVVTNSYHKSDGYYSEGLGYFGKEFIEEKTRKFVGFFDHKDCFTDSDLRDWTGIAMLELSLLAENESSDTLLTGYVNRLERNCRDCSIPQKATLRQFIRELKKRWAEYIATVGEPSP